MEGLCNGFWNKQNVFAQIIFGIEKRHKCLNMVEIFNRDFDKMCFHQNANSNGEWEFFANFSTIMFIKLCIKVKNTYRFLAFCILNWIEIIWIMLMESGLVKIIAILSGPKVFIKINNKYRRMKVYLNFSRFENAKLNLHDILCRERLESIFNSDRYTPIDQINPMHCWFKNSILAKLSCSSCKLGSGYYLY